MTIASKVIFCFLFIFCLPLFSFDDGGKINIKYFYTTHLACLDIETNMLAKKSFDSLIALPLCAKDSMHMNFPIQSFEVTYAERGLYQDSAGLPIIFTDYSNIRCEGNTLPKSWVDLFNERSYKGDTIYIDNVKVRGNDNKSYAAKGLKIIIK